MIDVGDTIKLNIPWDIYQKTDIMFTYHHPYILVGLVDNLACIESLWDETRHVVDIQYLQLDNRSKI